MSSYGYDVDETAAIHWQLWWYCCDSLAMVMACLMLGSMYHSATAVQPVCCKVHKAAASLTCPAGVFETAVNS